MSQASGKNLKSEAIKGSHADRVNGYLALWILAFCASIIRLSPIWSPGSGGVFA